MVKELKDDLHLLKTVKGQLNTAIRHLSTLSERIGETPLPKDFPIDKDLNYTRVGEILHEGMLNCAVTCKKLERVTNLLRTEAGLDELDYSNTNAEQVLKHVTMQLLEHYKEAKEKEAA